MSEIRAATFSNAAGTGPADFTGQWASRAVLNYDQVTPAIDQSENIASVTDNGTGDFTPSYTAAFGATDYLVVTGAVGFTEGNPGGNVNVKIAGGSGSSFEDVESKLTGSVIMGVGGSGSVFDAVENHMIWIGDLA